MEMFSYTKVNASCLQLFKKKKKKKQSVSIEVLKAYLHMQ